MNHWSTHLPSWVKLTALTAFVWASLKVILIAQSYGILTALVFSSLHLPWCLFSTLCVWWLFELHQGIGFLALTSSLLNAVLI